MPFWILSYGRIGRIWQLVEAPQQRACLKGCEQLEGQESVVFWGPLC